MVSASTHQWSVRSLLGHYTDDHEIEGWNQGIFFLCACEYNVREEGTTYYDILWNHEFPFDLNTPAEQGHFIFGLHKILNWVLIKWCVPLIICRIKQLRALYYLWWRINDIIIDNKFRVIWGTIFHEPASLTLHSDACPVFHY